MFLIQVPNCIYDSQMFYLILWVVFYCLHSFLFFIIFLLDSVLEYLEFHLFVFVVVAHAFTVISKNPFPKLRS